METEEIRSRERARDATLLQLRVQQQQVERSRGALSEVERRQQACVQTFNETCKKIRKASPLSARWSLLQKALLAADQQRVETTQAQQQHAAEFKKQLCKLHELTHRHDTISDVVRDQYRFADIRASEQAIEERSAISAGNTEEQLRAEVSRLTIADRDDALPASTLNNTRGESRISPHAHISEEGQRNRNGTSSAPEAQEICSPRSMTNLCSEFGAIVEQLSLHSRLEHHEMELSLRLESGSALTVKLESNELRADAPISVTVLSEALVTQSEQQRIRSQLSKQFHDNKITVRAITFAVKATR